MTDDLKARQRAFLARMNHVSQTETEPAPDPDDYEPVMHSGAAAKKPDPNSLAWLQEQYLAKTRRSRKLARDMTPEDRRELLINLVIERTAAAGLPVGDEAKTRTLLSGMPEQSLMINLQTVSSIAELSEW